MLPKTTKRSSPKKTATLLNPAGHVTNIHGNISACSTPVVAVFQHAASPLLFFTVEDDQQGTVKKYVNPKQGSAAKKRVRKRTGTRTPVLFLLSELDGKVGHRKGKS